MAVKLEFTPLARDDLRRAYRWYEDRSDGLGDRFLSTVYECVDQIQDNPRMFSVVHESHRCVTVRKFPYVIYYELRDDCVVVHAVLHSSQDADRWRRRLP